MGQHIKNSSISIFILLVLNFSGFANKKPEAKTNWTATPFSPKVFVENKGQFAPVNGAEVFFMAEEKGQKIYFTAKGLFYTNLRFVPEKEESSNELNEGFEPERQKGTLAIDYVNMEWVGANANVQVVAEKKATGYFSYPVYHAEKKYSSIKAETYEKITYKNLYPNIDVEYIFPANKSGFKYNIILQPGANASLISMKYSGINSMEASKNGDINILSSFVSIVDHAPKTFYEGGDVIPSCFIVEGNNTIRFQVSQYTNSRKLIIDPWTTLTPFSGLNKAYDVNYDNDGNVFVYGNDYPFELIKYNNIGDWQWTYIGDDFIPQSNTPSQNFSLYYGDFAVDEVTGISYICQGARLFTGAQIAKVGSDGFLMNFFTGNPTLEEMWRMVYDPCTGTIVIGGGGVGFRNQACVLDKTGDMDFTPVNVVQADVGFQDMAMVAADGYGNCFMVSSLGDLRYANKLWKLPFPNLAPTIYSVPLGGQSYAELNAVAYMPRVPTLTSSGPGTASGSNGYNGIAASLKYVYTYTGFSLKKWENATGNFVKQITNISPSFRSGGLAVDGCDNLYVGTGTSLRLYDDSLELLETFALPDTVYDVKLDDENDNVYICGKGFVMSQSLRTTSCLKINFTPTPTCDNTGAAIAEVVGGVAPYTYQWDTGPNDTTTTIQNLVPGKYKVTVTDQSCIQVVNTDSVIVDVIRVHFTQNKDSIVNVFTPNGDNLNDVFYPYVSLKATAQEIEQYLKNYSLKIYDRWGTKVHEGMNYNNGWDGMNNSGNNADEGVYFWVCEFETDCTGADPGPFKTYGFVHLNTKK